MNPLDLNGTWKMKRTTDEHWLDGTVPGSVTLDTLKAGLIGDPFYRDNEDEARALSQFDYEYSRSFTVQSDFLERDQVLLICEGLDTLAVVEVNGMVAAETDNMHRTYEFDVKPLLHPGENQIRVEFKSPERYVTEKQMQTELWGPGPSVAGFPHLRKAHYMFGWDWGPIIPDMGIWRDIYLVAYDRARLSDVYVTQSHSDTSVDLDVRLTIESLREGEYTADVTVRAPSGNVVKASVLCSGNSQEHAHLRIDNPELWWPNGLGAQPLYEVQVMLRERQDTLDERGLRIGLRSLTVSQEKDQWGESFAFTVNGTSIFAKGANYIPEDNLLGRCTRERTERLLKDVVAANHNCIRVWGGGIYQSNDFYDLCDELGLIVWQDFMFACGVYELTESFLDTVKQEAIDNVKRLRHHACIALWCGNNEMEQGWHEWGFPKTAKLRTDYLRLFEILLPDVMKEYDPNTFYWPASPSSGGGFENPNDENIGDVHYWEVWHGEKSFTEYRKYYFRFCSEFGFQSFPALMTIESFTEPGDRNVFSRILERHQRCDGGNGKVLSHLSQNFLFPKNFDSLLYLSQLLQAESIKYGVEHWRRNLGRCMGAIYWQLNDCWPVASWSSIDSTGRWKALHYFSKRFYAPVLISACDEGDTVELHVTNERLSAFEGEVQWALRNGDSTVVRSGRVPVKANSMSTTVAAHLDFEEEMRDSATRLSRYLEFSLAQNGTVIGHGTVLFVKPKYYEWKNPKLQTRVEDTGTHFKVVAYAEEFAKYVELALCDCDVVFGDNYFDLPGGTSRTVEVDKSTMPVLLTAEGFAQRLTVRSLFDTSGVQTD